ncbi:TetR/AcrR family transcriptional regulator [Hymenobacter terrenus]|uniref:TetR/AcrR family transcriptional regulator n=1 Tax=Hymenobacter terrenus TaxID=1629124 RepID=UPI0006196B20|nr:TetR/AcrR family transcriptional regulator [Hymenobacter terrenus]
MAGRPKEFDEVDALSRAQELFWRQGYGATSTEDLLAAMGLRKGSLYHTFGSKRGVFVQATKQFGHEFLRALRQALQQGSDPLEVLCQTFRALADPSHAAAVAAKGCYFGNTLVEMATLDPEMQHLAAQGLMAVEQVFYEALSQAQQAGQLSQSADPRALARYLINLWNGLNISRRMYTPQDLIPIIETGLQVLV